MGFWDFWAEYNEALLRQYGLDKFSKCEVQQKALQADAPLDREANNIGLAVSRFLSAVKRMPIAYSRKPKDYDYRVKTVGDDLFRRKMKRDLGIW